MPWHNDPPPSLFRSGFVAVVGRPNVGKSTLLNAILGQKIAIVSPKPQTTRRKQLGIYTTEHVQIIFVDTPGILRPRHSLDKFMIGTAYDALDDADVILWLVNIAQYPGLDDRRIADLLHERAHKTPLVIAMNKSDRLKPQDVMPHTDAYRGLLPRAGWMIVSATRGDNIHLLLNQLTSELPEGPRYYPEDQVTLTHLRELSAELIRESALHVLQDEVPHGIAVEVDEFDETSDRVTRILATVFVERKRHKGMVIGKKASTLKRIGMRARKEIETLLSNKVYLQLYVKVSDGWRADEVEVIRKGYRTSK